ncbi:MAG: threonine--tRNA ligase [Trueperaceae bacterium]|jgi:threonyl-tRNA synthetase|nr:threonine--tRNA ligase [Truepera sp.]HRN19396.1 threonine--tRNA ligase [Trueperaceae bacterium]
MFVLLPDGKRLDVPPHATGADVAGAIGPGLAKAALGVRVDGKLSDLQSEVPEGARVEVLTKKDDASIFLARHTLAHIMAQAVREMFVAEGFAADQVRMGIGPVIENGFYYDFDLPRTLTPEDLEGIDRRMRELVKADLPLVKYELPRSEALARFEAQGDPYKVELINDLPEGEHITFYEQGGPDGFTDLCRGPHLPRTGAVPLHFKLMNVAGAYWRGDETRPMLQRIYGVAFATKEELEHHLWQLEEARKRDHRKLGKELKLFTFADDVGPGLPLFLPRGEIIRHEMERFVREEQTAFGYEHVWTGHMVKEELYVKSGHMANYVDDMFPPMVDGEVSYRLKPMNCPSHMTLFNTQYYSYRDLPLRMAEFATLYRNERSGQLSGLTRVRSLTQDDCHIFCTPEQVRSEFALALRLIRQTLDTYGMTDYRVQLSLRGDKGKYLTDDDKWEQATTALRQALDAEGVAYVEEEGEAAFYGPKADFMARDALGREWQLSTIQVDFIQPARLGCEYVAEDGSKQTPVVIHRAVTGSTERFMGVMLEHFAGDLPLWLAPEQVRVVPISDRHREAALRLVRRFKDAGLRAGIADEGERMNAAVRDAELLKIPYIVILGDKEEATESVSFRSRKEPNRNGVATEAFVAHLRQASEARVLEVAPLG